MKRDFSDLTLKEAMQSIVYQEIEPWEMEQSKREPSDILQEYLRRCFQSFDMTSNDGKRMLVDALLLEIVPSYPRLKVWHDAPLETKTLSGTVDYLLAPKRAYLDTPLLCVTLAQRDDFDAARIKCIAQMAACRENNRRDGHYRDIYGIVSNGHGWVFYQLVNWGQFFESGVFTFADLPTLLGAVNYVCLMSAHFATMSRDMPDEGEKVTLRYFYPEELHLMRNCLIAATEEIYASDDELKTLTGTSRAEYAALLAEFGTMPEISKHDWDTIRGIIGILTNYPVNNRKQLCEFLGFTMLHLSWFGDKMLHIKEHWLSYAETSAKVKQARAEWVQTVEDYFSDFKAQQSDAANE